MPKKRRNKRSRQKKNNKKSQPQSQPQEQPQSTTLVNGCVDSTFETESAKPTERIETEAESEPQKDTSMDEDTTTTDSTPLSPSDIDTPIPNSATPVILKAIPVFTTSTPTNKPSIAHTTSNSSPESTPFDSPDSIPQAHTLYNTIPLSPLTSSPPQPPNPESIEEDDEILQLPVVRPEITSVNDSFMTEPEPSSMNTSLQMEDDGDAHRIGTLHTDESESMMADGGTPILDDLDDTVHHLCVDNSQLIAPISGSDEAELVQKSDTMQLKAEDSSEIEFDDSSDVGMGSLTPPKAENNELSDIDSFDISVDDVLTPSKPISEQTSEVTSDATSTPVQEEPDLPPSPLLQPPPIAVYDVVTAASDESFSPTETNELIMTPQFESPKLSSHGHEALTLDMKVADLDMQWGQMDEIMVADSPVHNTQSSFDAPGAQSPILPITQPPSVLNDDDGGGVLSSPPHMPVHHLSTMIEDAALTSFEPIYTNPPQSRPIVLSTSSPPTAYGSENEMKECSEAATNGTIDASEVSTMEEKTEETRIVSSGDASKLIGNDGDDSPKNGKLLSTITVKATTNGKMMNGFPNGWSYGRRHPTIIVDETLSDEIETLRLSLKTREKSVEKLKDTIGDGMAILDNLDQCLKKWKQDLVDLDASYSQIHT